MLKATKLVADTFALHPYGSVTETQAAINLAIATCVHPDGTDLSEEFICDKYVSYVQMCKSDGRTSKHIKTFENFVKDKMYEGKYQSSDHRLKNNLLRWMKGITGLIT